MIYNQQIVTDNGGCGMKDTTSSLDLNSLFIQATYMLCIIQTVDYRKRMGHVPKLRQQAQRGSVDNGI